jgi:hypothetical protein
MGGPILSTEGGLEVASNVLAPDTSDATAQLRRVISDM